MKTPHLTSPHLTSPHLTSPHLTSPHLISFRKPIVYLIALCCTVLGNAYGQNSTLIDLNADLRTMFSPLDKPANPLPFLYDMAGHKSDSAFFTVDNSSDTLETDMWYSIYEEMYHSAYDTASLLTVDSVINYGSSFYADTIAIAIMNYKMYTFKDSALTTNIYFDFDTINDVLTDKYPRPSFPYNEGEIFVAAPALGICRARDPFFRIDPQLIFTDAFTASNFTMASTVLQIDFGDGNGWITFNPAVVTNYYVDYSSGGEKLIQTLLYNDSTRMYSMSRIIVGPRSHHGIYYEPINVPGLNVGLFSSTCLGENVQRKTVIYLEGFDFMDFIPAFNRGIGEIYSEMITTDRIVQLKNEGYDLVVVDWQNSRIDIRFNALYLVNLIEHLKCINAENDNNQEFVIMGESMGGLVARFALTYMETEYYSGRNTSPFFVDDTDPNNTDYLQSHVEIYDLPHWCDATSEKMHNTRLFITLDTPHQGANIPMSIQYAYRHTMAVFGGFINPLMMQSVTAANLFLDAQAAQQMLIYHIDTKSGLPPYFNYSDRSEKDAFFDQLAALGNYPNYAKVMAMSNGSLQGVNQYNFLTNTSRTANDRLLEFNCDLSIKVLGKKVPMFHGELSTLTNPNGHGNIITAAAGGYHLKLKVKWFKIKISWTYHQLLSVSEKADLKPYCTSAGGWIGSDGFNSYAIPNNVLSLSNRLWLNFFHASYTVNNSCITYDTHLGLNGILTQNFDYSLCSDGLNFGFIPVQSALDYDVLGNNPLNLNIGSSSSISLATRLANVNASVISGYDDNDLTANHGHVGYRNDLIDNINRDGNYTYVSCIEVDNTVERGFLNAEIGDEELYLENCTLPWYADYQAQFDIHVNDRSPYYEYVTQPYSGSPMLKGIYSKENAFIITSSGTANFYYDSGNSPTGIGLSIGSPPGGTYNAIDQDQTICECNNYIGSRMADSTHAENNSANSVSIYPNPNDGNLLTLAYTLKQDLPVQVIITSAYGVVVYRTTDAGGSNKMPLNITPLNLGNGLYAVILSNGMETKSIKLLIQK